MELRVKANRIMMVLFFSLLSCPMWADGKAAIVLSDSSTYEFVTHYADCLPDAGERYTIDDVIKPDLNESFAGIGKEGFLSGDKRSVWLRFRLKNDAAGLRRWYLEYDYFKNAVSFECYIPTGTDTSNVKRAYPGMPASELDFAYRNYVFAIDLAAGETETVYLKAVFSSDIYMVLKIWHPVIFQNMTRAEQLFIGLFLGIMLIMGFYNLFLFFSFRDISYIHYVIFIVCLSVLQLNNHHLLSEWFGGLAQYETIITTGFKLFSFISFLSFSRSFLSIKTYFPRLDKLFSLAIYLVTGTGLLSFAFGLFKTVNSLFMAASGVFVVAAAVCILIKGNRSALFFLVATASIIAFGVLVLIPAEYYYTKTFALAVPFFIDIGALVMIVLFSLGLGYRIRVLQKEKEQVEIMKEKDRLKSQYFAYVSHEFRTPLNLLTDPLNDLLSTCKEPEQREIYDLMVRNTGRLIRLVNQLLDLSKLESGKMRLHVSKQDMIPFLSSMVKCFSHLAARKQQRLSIIADREPIPVYIDMPKFEQVFLNLLNNAIKYTPAGGRIGINVRVDGGGKTIKQFPEGFVEVTVSNTGPGIPHEYLERVFECFYQTETDNGQLSMGSGIGLALVKELIALHHGSVSVDGKTGQADPEENLTVFTIRLPLGKKMYAIHELAKGTASVDESTLFERIHDLYNQEQAAIDDESETADVKKDSNGNSKILIIEDDNDLRKYLGEKLKTKFFVFEAADGEEGIKKARAVSPDLVICDIMMAGVDGFEVTRTLKNNIETCHIPIVLLTAKATEENIVRGLELGADDYIIKPFVLNVLIARVTNLIRIRRQMQAAVQKQLLLEPSELTFTSIDQKFLRSLHDAIETNLSDQGFGIETLTRELYLSRATLNRKIRALTGQPTNQYIKTYRLKKAAQMLLGNFGNVTEVCYAVGFSDHAYFTKCFKEMFGKNPSEYRPREDKRRDPLPATPQ